MKKSLILFTIGPVQPFIAASRKTVDLYAGSVMLSEITAEGIKYLLEKNGEMVFPYIKNADELKNEGPASIPNRFMALIPQENDIQIAEEIEKSIIDRKNYSGKVHEIANKIKAQIESADFKDNLHWQNEWKEQTNSFWEVYWVIKRIDDINDYNENYAKYYSELEQLMGMRKNLRDFKQLYQLGIKCSTFLNYSAVFPLNHTRSDVVFSDARLFSKKYLAKKFPGKYKDKERLSSLAIIKREYKNLNFPSTVNLANDRFNCAVVDKYGKDELFDKLLEKYIEKYKELKKYYEFSSGSNYPVLLRKAKDKAVLKEFLDSDNDALFKETTTLESVLEVSNSNEARETFFEFEKTRKKLIAEVNCKPSRYYAVFYFDGDNLGKWLSGSKENEQGEKFKITPEIHAEISKTLKGFSQNKVKEVVEANKLGKLVFAGGDDVIAFASIDDVLDIVNNLQKAFSEIMKEAVNGHAPVTASCGIAIAHSKHNFQEVLTRAREAEHFAKENLGRNAFALATIKHSGEFVLTGAKFSEDEDYIKLMTDYMELISAELLSTNFVYDVEAHITPILVEENEKVETEIFASICKMLLKRHSEKEIPKVMEFGEYIYKIINRIENRAVNNTVKLKDIIMLLKTAQFIVRGGE